MANCSPKKDIISRTKYLNQCTGTVLLEGGSCQQTSGAGDGATTINLPHLQFSYIRTAWNIVRPPSSDTKTIVNGSKKPKYNEVAIQVPVGEDQDGNVVLGSTYYKQQEYAYDENTGESVPVFERQCQADIGYDERYFYHVFEWPLSFTLEPRTVGGFVSTTTTITNSEDNTTTTTITYEVESSSVSAQLSLAKVDSQVEGIPEGSPIYHGGTDSNAIFFQYESTSKTVLAAGDKINGWTVSKVVNYNAVHANDATFYVSKTVRKRISKRSKKNRSPSFIFINNNVSKTNKKRRETESANTFIDVVNPGDIVSGSKAIRPGTTVVSIEGNKINLSQPLGKGKVKEVKFYSAQVTNSQNDGTVCYAELTGTGSNFVPDAFYDINSSSGPQSTVATVRHVFNDDRNFNVDLTTVGSITVEPRSLRDRGGNNNSEERKHYLVTFTDATVISNINDINIQVTQNLSASGVSTDFSIGKIELVDNKSFKIWFISNKSDSNSFVRAWSVSVGSTTTGNRIKVVAGKGIINRSAVVGTYVSNDKKQFVYKPLLYKTDEECDDTRYEDSNAQYILGDVVLSDSTDYLIDAWLCVKPETNLAYDINNIYWNLFNRPVDKEKMEYWISQYRDDISDLKLKILNTEQQALAGRYVSKIVSSECGNPIDKDYTKVYYPYDEFKTFDDLIRPLSTGIGEDPCLDIKAAPAYTEEELKNTISKNIEGNFTLSAITVPNEMYRKLVSDENSLQNMLLRAVRTVSTSIPKSTQIPNLPPQIEAEDSSNIDHIAPNANRLPPRIKKIQYFIDDMSLISDTELDPYAPSNNIEIVLKSIPRWTSVTTVDGINGDDVSPGNGIRVVSNKTNGYLDTIQVLTGEFAPVSPEITIPGLTPPAPTKAWVQDTADTADGGVIAGPWPSNVWHGAGINYQQEYEKLLNFRINEISEYVSDAVKNKGNPFQDNPEYAKIMKTIMPSDTKIVVDSTAAFPSSGYLMIPKYTVKIDVNPETKNESTKFYYLGEEIVYYKRKTQTEFRQCTRGMFGTSPDFETSVSTSEIDAGVYYIIKSLGNTNWQNYGAPAGAGIGTIFQATKDGVGSTETGEATLFESTNIPFNNKPVVNAVTNSYEKRNYVVQYWPVQIQDKDVI
jgi:hypothetical protein